MPTYSFSFFSCVLCAASLPLLCSGVSASAQTLVSLNRDSPPTFSSANRYKPAFAPVEATRWSPVPTSRDTELPAFELHHPILTDTIDVVSDDGPGDAATAIDRAIAPRQMELSAGTFGDPSRYLQTLAGVVSDNDQRNDFLVRGGNPSENLFIIDGIDIPSINQLALSDTTGGFVSMLDAAAVQRITFHTDAYDSSFDQRLSSVVEISTRPCGPVKRVTVSELGIAGLGGSQTRPMGRDGSLFVSARQGLLQYLTSDIGMNGTPHYRNAFVRAENRIGDRDSWWGISLTGIDSIQMNPSTTDGEETNPYNVGYSGWRNTTGVNWQHLFSARAFGVASIAYAEQSQTVLETAQLLANATVYNEDTSDRIGTAKYDWSFAANKLLTLTAGGRGSLDELHYVVAQPAGLQNPYSADPTPLDATATAQRFATFSSAAYAQLTLNLPHHATLVTGMRADQWALGGHAGATGKALFAMPLLGRLLHVGYAEYEQMPSTLYLLSFYNLRTLDPIRCQHLVAGLVLTDRRRVRVAVDTYRKLYSRYPVASAYPQLSMANIADTFGQAFLMFPMTGKGSGLANGVELTAEGHLNAHVSLTGTVAYARSRYAGLDGVLHRGNYDLPLTANLTGNWRLPHALAFSWRYSIASGKPYTPDNMAESVAQNRDVYDLTRINGVRSGMYKRLDFRLEQARPLRSGVMTWHVGLQNALANKNFYSLAWEPFEHKDSEQDQMPLFPDGGVKYVF